MGWAGADDASTGRRSGADHGSAGGWTGTDRHGWADATGSWAGAVGVTGAADRAAPVGWADEPTGWGDAGRAHPSSWTDHTGLTALPTASHGGTGTDRRAGSGGGNDFADTGTWLGPVTDWTGTSADGWTEPAAEDAAVERLWLELSELDDSEVSPQAAETTDGSRRGSYRTGRRHIGRWSHARRTRSAYLNAALVRCGVYLGALSVAIAAAEPLGRVAWPVPAVMVLLGWTAAQALTSMGVTVARRGGPGAAARTVGAGFAAVIGLWCALVWIAPDTLLGPNRLLAATAGIGGLVTLATVTAALVTRAESAVAGWYTPCWLLAAAAMADAAGVPEAGLVPVQTMLPAAMVAVAIRAFQPALLPSPADRAARRTAGRRTRLTSSTERGARLTAADRRRAFAYLVIGAAQAFSVILLWRGGPDVMPLPAALPLLVAVPLLEGLIGWHTDRIDAGLDAAVTPEQYDRHVRNVTIITLAGLLPPLAAGCGLLVAAYRLPYGFSVVPGARDAVLALAAATLLGGVFAVTFLLAARTRHGIAATLAAIPPLAAAVLALFASPSGLLPAAVAVLAATHLAGLLIVALTAADLRRTP
ncbi:hypothetical protein [Actinoplanes sichuanensis]|uniref:hypothetical protein n=1 Tax=Actinoplanes sichuanensis TaxID=512349 RepID=UPI00295564F7|nr:hypothetical protein [Actinoplanes sichuanensis]